MKNTLFIVVLISLLFLQCKEEKDPFLIQSGAVGELTKDARMKQVDSIFASDSIVPLSSIQNALGTQGEVEIYDKAGSKLLLLSPENESDPDSHITNIQVFDDRFRTDKGLSPSGSFADVKANYEIASIENTINSVVVFLKDSDVYLTIDKKELPEYLRYNLDAKVEASQIPDAARFKYFMIGWDADSDLE
ncbi:MAG: hypothetical protein KJO23_03560 [Bacteroidia bacterium]|nr:hypothetical protein [Bacteroidia bacterium]NNM24189.1 hypothetical protein [Flavobacteriaceae bacterium]